MNISINKTTSNKTAMNAISGTSIIFIHLRAGWRSFLCSLCTSACFNITQHSKKATVHADNTRRLSESVAKVLIVCLLFKHAFNPV